MAFRSVIMLVSVVSAMAFCPSTCHVVKSPAPSDSTTACFGSEKSRRDFVVGSAAALLASSVFPSDSLAAANKAVGGRPQYGDEEIMTQKSHGTSDAPVQSDLKYGVSNSLADKICNFNRHFAEQAGYFKSTSFTTAMMEAKADSPITFHDSVTGKPLFVAPIGRSGEDFLAESRTHGWPSFRDQEVVWDNVRILRRSGETVSVDGTHLGHNLPDSKGNRYCINLVSVAGNPSSVA